jgi:alkylhydroperoxidase/carboxymuconolactone decarboxylase family protein YurZ
VTDTTDPYAALRERGAALRYQVLGGEPAPPPHTGTEVLSAAFRDASTALAWGGIWSRPGLALRDRSLLAVAVLTTLHRPDELAMHIPAAVRNGLTVGELSEALLHVGLYAGFPAARAAAEIAERVLDGRDGSPEVRP